MSGELPLVLLFPARAVNDSDRRMLGEDVFSVRGKPTELVPPIDWRLDPFDNRAWRFWLHTLQFLDVPLRVYEQEADLGALAKARDLALDWVTGNPIGGERTGDWAWTDMAAGVRASFLGYVWRECRRRSLIDPEPAQRLTEALHGHAEWLSDERNYTPETNHGLYEDAGLFLLGSYAAELEEASEWRAFAEARFLETLGRHIQFDEGGHKEHSPSYHMYIRELVDRLRNEAGIGGETLDLLLGRLDESAGWLVLPDQTLLPFGDTDMTAAPPWASAAAGADGMRVFFETGYAVVREGDSYMAMTCCYHTYAHKHADELSWCLYENGHLIVGEASRYGHRDERDPARIYARSSRGHNVLIVDDESFPWREAEPYGSGLLASGEGGGWYAVLAHNPLLARVEHHRLLLFRPRRCAIVVDRLRAEEEHEIVRRMHFGPELTARETPSGIVAEADGVEVAGLVDGSEAPTELSLARGVEQPRMDGWTFPTDGTRVPSSAVTLRNRIASGVLVHAVTSAPGAAKNMTAAVRGDEFLVSLAGDDADSVQIAVVQSGRTLGIEVR